MSTPTDEVTIDLEAADKKAVSETAKKTANGAAADATPDVEVENAAPEPQKAEKPVVTPDEGLEKLKKDLETERALRQDAERRAAEASHAEATARSEVQTSQLDLVKGAIERLTESSDVIESQLADALTAQDYKAVAKLQRQMAENASKLTQLEAGKKALESAPKPAPRTPTDPVEQFASALSPASATWVRAHPEFVRDPHKNRQMIAAHELALARGHKADTPEYFASVEKTLDIAAPVIAKTDAATDASAEAAQAVGGRAAPAAAPVSRSNGAHGNRPNLVKLTPEQVEVAQMNRMTPEEYARQLVALKKEGRIQ